MWNTHRRLTNAHISIKPSKEGRGSVAVGSLYNISCIGQLFFVRTIDRFGKGLRTGARDAVLSDGAKPQTKEKVFGFHRSMDTLGAVLGPLLALLYLQWHPQDYKTLFLIAFAPGLLAVLCSFLLKDKNIIQKPATTKVGFFHF